MRIQKSNNYTEKPVENQFVCNVVFLKLRKCHGHNKKTITVY